MTRTSSVAVVLIALLATSCASASPSASPSASAGGASPPLESGSPLPTQSDQGSIVVIGHSGATGYDSDPERRGEDVKANSWATGTNPDVASVYLRLLAQNPLLDGNNKNFAIDGSGVTSLIGQAEAAVAVTPTPELVLVQSIDNDMKCDGTDSANYEPYRAKLTEALDILTEGLPDAEIFFVSQWADVQTYDRVVFGLNPAHLLGTGPCDTVNPDTMQLDPAKETYLQGLVDDYWAIVTETCALYAACRTDGGAMQGMDLAPEDLGSDLNHLSAAGHAKMAAIVFEALSGNGG